MTNWKDKATQTGELDPPVMDVDEPQKNAPGPSHSPKTREDIVKSLNDSFTELETLKKALTPDFISSVDRHTCHANELEVGTLYDVYGKTYLKLEQTSLDAQHRSAWKK